MKKETKEKTKKSVGRPSAFNDEELLDKRINLWIAHFHRKLPYWELQKEYDVSASTVKKSIEWVQKNFVKMPNKLLLEGAMSSIKNRIQKMNILLEKELGRKEPSIRNAKELNSELRSDEIELHKLQNIYNEKYSVTEEVGGSIKDILKVLSEQKK